MGTNYYVRENECDKCGRFDSIHLGKSSVGWQFSFQYNSGKFYKNVPEMKKWLKDKVIRDEYGVQESQKDFWKMVAVKQKELNNHAKQYPSYTERVIDGYSFTNVKFS